eukprot:TRINITY_DN34052_c0_g1_i1.p1 TRINITY_DN34052_c0_g1~~TRINITY_DN34052_c0_g1_i1.p1  ORF type:complete len:605 (+),score=148.45 TRINITY_DN34052_c0_g1_i1:34-1848(+)
MGPFVIALVASVCGVLLVFAFLWVCKRVAGESPAANRYADNMTVVRKMEDATPVATACSSSPNMVRSPSLCSCKSWSDDAASPSASTVRLYPECVNEVFYDWGPGLSSCAQCNSRPILNRGCKMCGKRMCHTCFDAHKEERLSLLNVSQLTIQVYSTTGTAPLTPEEHSRLLHDLELPADSAGETIGRDGIITLLQAKPQVVPTLNALLKQQPRDISSSMNKGMALPECADERGLHDWGPGLTICALCSRRGILNRGCRKCGKRLCEKCFMMHMQMAKLAGAAMRGKLNTADPSKEGQVVADTVKDVERGTSVEPKNARDVPPDMALTCPAKSLRKVPYKVIDTVDFFDDPSSMQLLREGGALYHCSCKDGFKMTQQQLKMVASFVNISGFKDELAENSVSHLDPLTEEAQKHIYLLNKGMYVFPPEIDPADLNSSVLSSVAFHRACQPGSGLKKPKVWTDVAEPNTFRLTKPVIPLIWGVTFQLKCSVVSKDFYPQLSVLCDDLSVHHAILMERTKRVKSAVDSTLKLKSILLYHFLPKGGMIVTNVTAAANSSIPKVAAAIVDKLGSLGACEVYETAEKTRTYLVELARRNKAIAAAGNTSG